MRLANAPLARSVQPDSTTVESGLHESRAPGPELHHRTVMEEPAPGATPMPAAESTLSLGNSRKRSGEGFTEK